MRNGNKEGSTYKFQDVEPCVDFSQFLRYTLPGLAVFFEVVVIIVFISTPAELRALLATKVDISGLIGLIVLCAGAGFVFSIIHHMVFWSGGRGYKHKKIFTDWVNPIEAIITNDADKWNNRQCWTAYHVIKTLVFIQNPGYRSAFIFIDRQVNFLHAIGATLIGTVFNLIGFIVFTVFSFLSLEPSKTDISWLEILTTRILLLMFMVFIIGCCMHGKRLLITSIAALENSVLQALLSKDRSIRNINIIMDSK